ncbi:hypothetical protein [Actinoplanes ianthinogenes]|uniref:hypothetical protein n=1 Tax=Actinoplanes ianthinogenes TaxID=122358 RepID=UPI0016700106|nr:hypothetical protein [Actinoplanes ianthinogenes]
MQVGEATVRLVRRACQDCTMARPCIPSDFAPCIGQFLATRGLPDPVLAREPQ